MTYLKFDKTELVDLQYSAAKELLCANSSGAYCSTTISGCNTRKYHGLLVCPIEALENEMHVLLSSLDISVIQHQQEFNLGLHKYQGNHYEPKGHKYLEDFTIDTIPQFTYRVGGVQLSISKVLEGTSQQLLLRLTLDRAHSETKLRLKPMLCFRNIHTLAKENMHANTRVKSTQNGVIAQLYENYPQLYMQTSEDNQFVRVPLWYHDVEYIEEQKRGYHYKEDLFSPGYFELPLKEGETIYFSASLQEEEPLKLQEIFDKAERKRTDKESFVSCLHNAARQFVRKTDKGVEMIAGFPWYGIIPRDCLIAAPTLLLETNEPVAYLELIRTLLDTMEWETGEIWGSKQVSVDAPLWLFYSLYQYKEYVPQAPIWNNYGSVLKKILTAYKTNKLHHIQYMDNGLLYIANQIQPLTWMNSHLNGEAVVKRYGYVVEVCALWYNAICCAMDWAKAENDFDFVEEWMPVARLVEEHYLETFSDEMHDYLADCVTPSGKDFSFRPSQLLAVALPHTVVDKDIILKIRRLVKQELLTPKGIRTLSPQHANYNKSYEGNHEEREQKMHQGTVYPWLLSFYCEAYMKAHNRSVPDVLAGIFENFEEDMTNYGVGTIAEMYDADPPQTPCGAIAMATSVAALLRINRLRKRWTTTHSMEEE